MDEAAAESVVDRLLLALAGQIDEVGDRGLAAGAVEAFADLSRAEAALIFGQAGHLVHYGAGTGPLETLIQQISAIQRGETSPDDAIRPGDEVRLVGPVPESLAEYAETWVRETLFVVRYVGRNAMVDVQADLSEDWVIATVPAAVLASSRK